MQPFDRHITGENGDVEMAKNFIYMALKKSPDLQVYIYARWPKKDRNGSLDYGEKWLRKYTGKYDRTNETKDYFERLTYELRNALPELKKPVLMVPVGHVMYELDKQMKAGRVPGYFEIGELYEDRSHLNDTGSYIVGCTFYTVLYRENPSGSSAMSYGILDTKLKKTIQETVWDVVSAHELSGVEKTSALRTRR